MSVQFSRFCAWFLFLVDQGRIAIMSLESGLVLEFDIESLTLKVLVLKVRKSWY